MHGTMHTSILEGNLRALASIGCTVVPPRDAYGKHNLPDEVELVRAVVDAVSSRRASPARQAASPRPQ
jgi:phosphopantothenoylcysteine decarboxylase/phosphopantothenate--cysteine ligase